MIYLEIDPFHPPESVIETAGGIVKEGGVICYPTETLYGLGGNALSSSVIRKVNRAKGRPENEPCIMLIDKSDAENWIKRFDTLKRLIDLYWPGPLTLVVEPARTDDLPEEILGPGGGLALRAASLPLDLALIRKSGMPILSTSANRSGEPPRTTLEGAREWLETFCDIVLDSDKIYSKGPSTIIDVREFPEKIHVLREGAISIRAIQEDFPTTEFRFARKNN